AGHAVGVAGRDVDGDQVAGVEGEEAGQRVAGGAVECLDVPARCAGAGADDDIGLAVVVEVPRRHAHPAVEAGEGEETADLGPGGAVEDLDVGGDGGCPDDDVRRAVAVDVAHRHVQGAPEADERRQAAHQLAVADVDIDLPGQADGHPEQGR